MEKVTADGQRLNMKKTAKKAGWETEMGRDNGHSSKPDYDWM